MDGFSDPHFAPLWGENGQFWDEYPIHILGNGFLRKKKKPLIYKGFLGEPGGIRTHDLLIRSQTLYPAELRAHTPL